MFLQYRSAGILLPITSFPSEFGIGDLEGSAKAIVDWVSEAGFSYLQVLPINPTGYGDCPYAPLSVFAGNISLIGLDAFLSKGLLTEKDVAELRSCPAELVDYGKIIPLKLEALKVAHGRWCSHSSENEKSRLDQFCQEQESWLSPFAVFMAQKRLTPSAWWDWKDESLKDCTAHAIETFETAHRDEVHFDKWTQWIFFNQWLALKDYANSRGIKIIGDAPLYVSPDSVDAWAYRDVLSNEVAGVPPDRHQASTGQLWNNPVYAWEHNKAGVFEWWLRRLEWLSSLFDVVRLDHFRGLLEAWAVPSGSSTAVHGRWIEVPGYELLERAKKRLGGSIHCIAEDLGEMNDEQVRRLSDFRRAFEIPGIALTAIYGFDGNSENPFHPEALARNHAWDKVPVSSTHDDNTVNGWWQAEAHHDVRERVRAYHWNLLHRNLNDPGWSACEIVLHTASTLAILRWQDIFNLPAHYRDNVPGVASGNWTVRVPQRLLSKTNAWRIRELIQQSGRVHRL